MSSKWVRRVAAVAMGFALAGRGVTAFAQGSAMDDEARRLYDEARKARDKGDHATCVAKTRAAWALKKHRQVAGLLGECELKTGAHRDAAEHLAYFLDRSADAAPDLVDAVRANYDQARAEIAVVTVKASAPDADRKVDGRVLASDELRVFLTPGEHVFAASKAGGGSAEKRIYLVAGQERDVVLDLAGEAPSGAPTTPTPAAKPASASAEAPAEPAAGPSVVPGIIVGGVGLVGVGVGVALLVAGGGAGSDANDIAKAIEADDGDCEPPTSGFASRCEEFDAAAGDEATLSTLGAISLIGGGALLLGGGAWTIWAATSGDDASSARAPHVTITPSFGVGGAALQTRGTF